MKVTQKTISVLRLADNTEYYYNVVKKLTKQGLLYICVNQAFDFMLMDQVDLEEDQTEVMSYQLDTNFTKAQRIMGVNSIKILFLNFLQVLL